MPVTGVVVYLFLYILFPEHTQKKLKIKPDAAPTEEKATGE